MLIYRQKKVAKVFSAHHLEIQKKSIKGLFYERLNSFNYPVAYTEEMIYSERIFFINKICVLGVQFQFVETI